MSSTRLNTGGPRDGAGLYPEGHVPCLECGRVVAEDWDGLGVVWHFAAFGLHCLGSRTSLSADGAA